MNNKDCIADSLAKLADTIADLPECELTCSVSIHGVTDGTALRKLLKILDAAESNIAGGTHWITGDLQGVSVVLYHAPSLLIECAKAVPV